MNRKKKAFAEASIGIVRLLRQKDCRGTAEGNDAFKFLSRQLYCRRLFS